MLNAITVILMLLAATAGVAQDRKIEISPYAGGLFSAGFQNYTQVPLFTGATGGKFQPARQASSGIFGLRGSYGLLPKLAIEGTIGYSPLGVDEDGFPLSPSVRPFLELVPQPGNPLDVGSLLPISPLGMRIAGKDTITYSGNVVFHASSQSGWQPFLTGGLGVVQRRADYRFSRGPLRTLPNSPIGGIGGIGGTPTPPDGTSVVCRACSFPLPEPGTTNFAVNFGGGVKRYLSDRWGVRVDLRDTISKHRGDTVNNPEVTFGLIFRH